MTDLAGGDCVCVMIDFVLASSRNGWDKNMQMEPSNDLVQLCYVTALLEACPNLASLINEQTKMVQVQVQFGVLEYWWKDTTVVEYVLYRKNT